MTTMTSENIQDDPLTEESSVTRRTQLKHVATIAEVIKFTGLEGSGVYATKERSKKPVAELRDGGILFRGKLYKLPHTAAIAYETLYGERWSPLNGWLYWEIERNGQRVTLAQLREEYLDDRMARKHFIQD